MMEFIKKLTSTFQSKKPRNSHNPVTNHFRSHSTPTPTTNKSIPRSHSRPSFSSSHSSFDQIHSNPTSSFKFSTPFLPRGFRLLRVRRRRPSEPPVVHNHHPITDLPRSHSEGGNGNQTELLPHQPYNELDPRQRNSYTESIPRQRHSHNELSPRQHNSHNELTPRQRNSHTELIPRQRNSHTELTSRQRNSHTGLSPNKHSSHTELTSKQRSSHTGLTSRQRDTLPTPNHPISFSGTTKALDPTPRTSLLHPKHPSIHSDSTKRLSYARVPTLTSQVFCDEPEPLPHFLPPPTFHTKSASTSDYTFLTESPPPRPTRPGSWQPSLYRPTPLKKYPSSTVSFAPPSPSLLKIAPSQHYPLSSETLVAFNSPLPPHPTSPLPPLDFTSSTTSLQTLAKLISHPVVTPFPPIRTSDPLPGELQSVTVHPPLSRPKFFSCQVREWESS